MNRTHALLLLAAEVALITKMIINQDFLIAMIIIFAQLIIGAAAINFGYKEKVLTDEPRKKMAIVLTIAMLATAPLLIHHEPRFEPSTWSEASVLMQGPFSIMLVLFGVFSAVIAAMTSLYLRGKK